MYRLQAVRRLRDAGATWWEALRLVWAGMLPISGGDDDDSGLSCDFVHDLIVSPSVVPQSIAAGVVNGTAIDCVNQSEMGALLKVGAIAGASTVDCTVQESLVQGSGFQALSPAVSFPQITSANQTRIINFKRTLRYVRLVVTVGGTSALVDASVLSQQKVY